MVTDLRLTIFRSLRSVVHRLLLAATGHGHRWIFLTLTWSQTWLHTGINWDALQFLVPECHTQRVRLN